MQKKSLIALSIGTIFIIGAGAIVYYGRPVMHLEDTDSSSANTENINSDDEQNTDDADGKGDKVDTNENVETSFMTSQDQDENQDDTPPPTAPTTSDVADAPPPTPNTYTSAQVATHNTESSCWASVGGNVYDLTSWVSRHPGGSKAIINLCGIDATAKFEGKHGGSSAAKAALALLKMGTLVE